MTTSERSIVDANVLVYAAAPSAPQYQASRALLESGGKLCVSPQVFAEFYSVVTNPRRVMAPFTPGEARTFIGVLLPHLPMLGPVVARWAELAVKHGVTGSGAFDLQLVATMLENRVRRIYTHNRSDFEPFADLEVVTP